MKEALAFDDVLLVPEYSDIISRLDPRLDFSTYIGKIKLKIPLISSPMDTVTEFNMALALGLAGGMGVLHRFHKTNLNYYNIIQKLVMEREELSFPIVPAIGILDSDRLLLDNIMDEYGDFIDMVSIDIANGYHIGMSNMIKFIKARYPNLQIMAGNIASKEGFKFLADLGANAVRTSIGGGCFGSNTKILMADGIYKKIIDIKSGDKVINKYGEPVAVKSLINSGFKRVVKVRTSNSWEPIYVTPDHNYWVAEIDEQKKVSKAKWLPVSEFQVDKTMLLTPWMDNFDLIDLVPTLLEKEYFYSKIISVEDCAIEIETWDIEVDCETHSFIANNSIVHNSICKTRIQTGFGVPTLGAILDCAEIKDQYPNTSLIADGGIRYPSDLVKSLVAGADAIMGGNIFAGTNEAPGKVIRTNDGLLWKNYRGMASQEVQEDKRGGMKPGTVSEGTSQLIPYKGEVLGVIEEFIGGLRSAMTMAGAKNISDLRKVRMVKITGAGLTESHSYGTRK